MESGLSADRKKKSLKQISVQTQKIVRKDWDNWLLPSLKEIETLCMCTAFPELGRTLDFLQLGN